MFVEERKNGKYNTDELFVGQRGPITRQTVHNIIKKYSKMSDVPLNKAHCHSFRHKYAINLINNDVSIDTVADLLGHKDINTTRIYTRKTKKELLNIINSI